MGMPASAAAPGAAAFGAAAPDAAAFGADAAKAGAACGGFSRPQAASSIASQSGAAARHTQRFIGGPLASVGVAARYYRWQCRQPKGPPVQPLTRSATDAHVPTS